MATRAAGAPLAVAVPASGASALATRAAGALFAVAVPAPGASALAVPAPGVLPTVAGHVAADIAVAARWTAGVLPAVAARAASPAGPIRGAQAVTAARPV